MARPLATNRAGVPKERVGNNINRQIPQFEADSEAKPPGDRCLVQQPIVAFPEPNLSSQPLKNK
jgi:hypothetical protein